MSETVLSTLCCICHSEPPKYKCPGCEARTCSLACSQKHKTRAECDGQRNPRAYVPISKLRTAAGVDHDFNFIHSIETARERAAKELVEVRQLLSDKELRPPNDEKQFSKVWYGDELHHVPNAPDPHPKQLPQDGPAGPEVFDKNVRRQLRNMDAEVVAMPKGMVRQKENTTSWNRRTMSINWQVEWLVSGIPGLAKPSQGLQQQQQPQTVRILHKSLEKIPLNAALATTVEWQRGQLDRLSREQDQGAGHGSDNGEADDDEGEDGSKPKKKKQRPPKKKRKGVSNSPNQDPDSSAWPTSDYTLQYSLTGEWNRTTTASSVPMTNDERAAGFARWQFFLQKADRSAPSSRILIPVLPTDTLASALAGRTIVEFPTIFVLPPGEALPQKFVLGSLERKKRKADDDKDETEQIPQRRPYKIQTFDRRGDGRPSRGARGQSRGRGRGRGHGRGRGGRVEFERSSANTVEIDDGEINSDGDDVMGGMQAEPEPFGGGRGEDLAEVLPRARGLVDYDSAGSD
ncbi:hypothetical protein B0T24DRAFT_630478 [Lasiosphaeria ovina]|uniref:HIT-type domain-containing protein n=1 Tax=Lasiosphaeria ovina TaxID=92902 RepID=A0AAE0N692_9PEZI|nr:hypothetical protein B0T24DRAFT_630478 [Lasiosphaeria ovina]